MGRFVMDHYVELVGIGVQTVLFLIGGYAMVLKTEWNSDRMTKDMQGMQEEIKELSAVVTQMAVQTVRLDNLSDHVVLLDKKIEGLRKGDGWITHRRNAVEGEYEG